MVQMIRRLISFITHLTDNISPCIIRIPCNLRSSRIKQSNHITLQVLLIVHPRFLKTVIHTGYFRILETCHLIVSIKEIPHIILLSRSLIRNRLSYQSVLIPLIIRGYLFRFLMRPKTIFIIFISTSKPLSRTIFSSCLPDVHSNSIPFQYSNGFPIPS